MSYDLHITRTDLWINSEKTPITYAEWQAYVESDPELTWEGWTDWKDCGRILTAAWSGDTSGEPQSPLCWHRGEIFAPYPSRQTTAKMVAIAEVLGAKVVGDDDEQYGPDGEAIFQEWPDMPEQMP